MANPTTNYGWPMPTSTDLVTDLPADFDAFGQPVDTTLKALNPETTLGDISFRSATLNTNTRLGIGSDGQVLAVSGGVPAWTTTADVTPLTTKGDLFTFTTVDARIGVGANGTVLTAASGEATGLQWATPSSGSMTQLATGALSGSTLTLSSISASYQDLLLVCNNFYPSANSYLSIKVNNTADIYARTSTTSSSNPINTAQIDFSNSEVYNADKDNYLAFRIDNYANTTSNKFGFENWILGNTSGTTWNIGQAIDAIRTTSAINRIDLILTAGSFSAGTYTLYGVK
jgi:hypothetical protein